MNSKTCKKIIGDSLILTVVSSHFFNNLSVNLAYAESFLEKNRSINKNKVRKAMGKLCS